MTKMEYAQKVAELVNGTVMEKEKNNDVIYTGVTINTEGDVSPIMYIDEFYEKGKDTEEVAEKFKEEVDKMKDFKFNVDVLNSFDDAKESIFVKLVNKKNAIEGVVYKSAEDYGYDDLILMPVVQIDVPGGKGATRVTKQMIENWEVTADEVISAGIENIDCIIESLSKKLSKLTGMPEDMYGGEDNPLVCISTEDGVCGAVAIIKARGELEKRFPDGYIVIPSSIHEMLAMPYDNERSDDDLNSMVVDVNTDVLAGEDFLSDHVYKFVA